MKQPIAEMQLAVLFYYLQVHFQPVKYYVKNVYICNLNE